MANTKTYQTALLSNILLIPSMNGSRGNVMLDWFKDKSDKLQLVAQLVLGWEEQHGMVMATPLASFWGDEAPKRLKEAIDCRKAIIEHFKNGNEDYALKVEVNGSEHEVTFTDGDVYIACQDLYTKAGKIIEPTEAKALDQICAFRRMTVMPMVNVVRKKLGLPPITELPVVVKHYDDKSIARRRIDRTIDCMGENEKKTVGHLPTTSLDKILSVKVNIFDRGGRQADAQRAFGKRGMAQKTWEVCKLDAAYPEAGIFKLLAGENGAKLASAYRYEDMHKLLTEKASLSAVTAWAKKPTKQEQVSMMAKKDIKAIVNQVPNAFLKAVARTILLNDRRFLDIFTEEDVKEDVAEAMKKAVTAVFEKHGKADILADWFTKVIVPVPE